MGFFASGSEADARERCRALLGATLVLVTHEPSYAERCARQIRIKDGNVYEQQRANRARKEAM